LNVEPFVEMRLPNWAAFARQPQPSAMSGRGAVAKHRTIPEVAGSKCVVDLFMLNGLPSARLDRDAPSRCGGPLPADGRLDELSCHRIRVRLSPDACRTRRFSVRWPAGSSGGWCETHVCRTPVIIGDDTGGMPESDATWARVPQRPSSRGLVRSGITVGAGQRPWASSLFRQQRLHESQCRASSCDDAGRLRHDGSPWTAAFCVFDELCAAGCPGRQ
jgi:hypothetical protein